MTRGALIFAFNNEQTDYVKMAAWSAARVHRHLDIPVAVVTDRPDLAQQHQVFDRVVAVESESGGTRYFEDYDSTVTWYNATRTNAYELTPWDDTLLLDADFVVCSNTLSELWDIDKPLLTYQAAWNMATGLPLKGLNVYGKFDMPMSWATVIKFRKSNTARFVFDSMQMIKQNWQHYRDLYGIERSTYRNDFALSIALGIVSGHTNQIDHIPAVLATVMPDSKLRQLDQDFFEIQFRDQKNQLRSVSLSGTDFHAMGKKHLEAIIEAS